MNKGNELLRLIKDLPTKHGALPHWFNHLGEWLETGQGLLYGSPQQLHWRSVAGSPLSTEVFASALKQWPALTQLLLDLPHDPLLDPALGEVLQLWQGVPIAARHTHVRSSGLALLNGENPLQALPKEALPQRLTFVLAGHKPSNYAMYSGRAAQELPALLEGLHQLLTWRKHQGLSQEELFIDLCFWLEPLLLPQLGDMIRLAETLGVDGLCFELLPSYSSKACVVSQALEPQHMVRAFKEQGLYAPKLRLPVALPPMKGLKEGTTQGCQSPKHTLALWSEAVKVQGCAHMPANTLPEQPLWEGDAWNSSGLRQLRRFWELQAQQQGVATEHLPTACKVCPMQPNSQNGPVLNPQWLPQRYQKNYSAY
jgi:hypothetical protein